MKDSGREALLALLDAYAWPEESSLRERFRRFVKTQPRCFENDCWDGHVTGSAWVLSKGEDQALLLLHAKLDKWLQPGGHSDGNSNTCSVALREAVEETGIKVELASPAIFDLDIHEIPARGPQPRHLHYDVRFAMWADPNHPPRFSEESREILWVPLEEIERYTLEESILRMVHKTVLRRRKLDGG